MSGRLKIYDDARLPPGCVVIAISPAPDTEALTVAISRRQSDRQNLGPQGWQAAAHSFTPAQIRHENKSVELIFGGEMTNHLPVSADIFVTVPQLGITERHFWPGVMLEIGATSVPVDLPGRKPLDLKNSGRPPEPEEPQDIAEFLPPETETNEPVFETLGDAKQAAAGGGRRFLWLIPAATLLAAALAAGLYLYPREDSAVVTVVPAENSADSEPSVEPAGPTFEGRYREYLGGSGHAQELLALGQEILASDASDARASEVSFNAITLAADRGSAPAKLLLGKWYDPRSTEREFVQPDPNVAALYYKDASDAGLDEATSALRSLCQAMTGASASTSESGSSFESTVHCQ